MSNPNTTRYVIRADLPVAEHLPPQTVYWRDGRGWAPRPLATVYTALDDVNTALDHGVPVADLRFCKIRTLKPKAAPPVKAPAAKGDALPRLELLTGEKSGDLIQVSALIPPGMNCEVKVGDRVIVDAPIFRGEIHVLTVTEINGTLAQCSSHP